MFGATQTGARRRCHPRGRCPDMDASGQSYGAQPQSQQWPRRGLPVLRRTRVYGVHCSSSLDAVRPRQPEPHAAIRQTAVERDRVEAPARDSPLDRIIGSPRDLRRDRRLSRRSY